MRKRHLITLLLFLSSHAHAQSDTIRIDHQTCILRQKQGAWVQVWVRTMDERIFDAFQRQEEKTIIYTVVLWPEPKIFKIAFKPMYLEQVKAWLKAQKGKQ